MSFYLYAETAFNHEGDEHYLRELIDAVADAGADGIKFQVLINLEELFSTRHSAFERAQNWIFSIAQWRSFFQQSLDRGLDVIMMPLDHEPVKLAGEFPISFIDLHSVSFYDEILLQKIKQTSMPLILGVGGRSLAEIEQKLDYFNDREIILMNGFQAFPSNLDDVRLARISYLRQKYPHLQIGYADHTDYADAYALRSLEFAFLLGARIFEKHATLNEGEHRIDYEAAVGMEKLRQIRDRLKYLDGLLSVSGERSLEMTEAEEKYRDRSRFVVATRRLQMGHVLTRDDLTLKMTDEAVGFQDAQRVIGGRLSESVEFDEVITGGKFE